MVKDKIRDYMTAEEKDIEKYIGLAAEAEAEGCKHAAGVLRDIAHDEETHLKVLSEMLHAHE